jgi:cation transport ATPase
VSTRGILALCLVLAAIGWVGLASFTYHNPPEPWNRWIAMAMLWPTLLAMLLPLVYGIHLRLNHEDIAPRAARQSALAALFLTLCVSLRMMHALNWANVILLLLLFALADTLLSTKRRR